MYGVDDDHSKAFPIDIFFTTTGKGTPKYIYINDWNCVSHQCKVTQNSQHCV